MFRDELRSRVEALFEDVGPLHIVSAVGFETDDAQVLADNKRSLSMGPWRYVEIEPDPASARRALSDAWDEPRLVVLAPKAVPPPLTAIVRAFLDHRHEVDLGDGERRPRREAQSLVVVVEGGPSSQHLPRALRHVCCWEIVP